MGGGGGGGTEKGRRERGRDSDMMQGMGARKKVDKSGGREGGRGGGKERCAEGLGG